MNKALLAAAAFVAGIAAIPANAATYFLDFSGKAGAGGDFAGNATIEVIDGMIRSGSGTLTIFDYVNAPITVISTSTPDNNAAGGAGTVGYRGDDGTDLYGLGQRFPFDDPSALVFAVGTTAPRSGANPLFLLYGTNNEYGSLYTGAGHYLAGYFDGTASIRVTAVGGAVPEPATWAMMVIGFGMVGAAARRRSVRVTFA